MLKVEGRGPIDLPHFIRLMPSRVNSRYHFEQLLSIALYTTTTITVSFSGVHFLFTVCIDSHEWHRPFTISRTITIQDRYLKSNGTNVPNIAKDLYSVEPMFVAV